jgi:hypothetical protein
LSPFAVSRHTSSAGRHATASPTRRGSDRPSITLLSRESWRQFCPYNSAPEKLFQINGLSAVLSFDRRAPAFIDAAALDPKWLDEFDAFENVLRYVDDAANNIPAAQEVFDFITDAIGDRAVPLLAKYPGATRAAPSVPSASLDP